MTARVLPSQCLWKLALGWSPGAVDAWVVFCIAIAAENVPYNDESAQPKFRPYEEFCSEPYKDRSRRSADSLAPEKNTSRIFLCTENLCIAVEVLKRKCIMVNINKGGEEIPQGELRFNTHVLGV
jgi:hypothetical protein